MPDYPRETVSGPPAPVTSGERIRSLDVLRGFALLGILPVNIQVFAMIDAALFNPTAYGDLGGANHVVHAVTHVFFDQKFMTIFSMLFGAGIVLFSERIMARGGSPAKVHYSRTAWLILFGLLHAHLLWYGDILYTYGMCALVVFLFRKLSPGWLIPLGLLAISVSSVLFLLFGLTVPFWAPEDLAQLEADFRPGAEAVLKELEIYRSGWLGQMEHRVEGALGVQTFVFLIWGSWRAGGLMLVGMGLYKLGVFSAKLASQTYAWMVAAGLFVGLPIVGYGLYRHELAGWNVTYSFFLGSQFNYWGSLFVSLGYVGLVMLLCKHSIAVGLQARLAAVGQTAFSNYILQTVICTTLFYGHGFGLFGKVSRTGQAGIVIAIWILQLALSPLWLRHYRFGPLEWLWRTLTYRKVQPFRRVNPQGAVS